MKSIVIVVLITGLLLSACDGSVIDLKASQFTPFVQGANHALVHFYSTDCGFCKLLNPVFQRVSKSLVDWYNITETMVQIDADIAKTISNQYQITGFPKIKYFHKGEVQDYSGERTHQSLLNFMLQKHGIVWTMLRTEEHVMTLKYHQFDQFLAENEIVGVLFDSYGLQLHAQTLEKAAHSFSHVIFGRVTNKTILERENVTSNTTFKLYKRIDGESLELPSTYSAKYLNDFLEAHSYPNVLSFDDKSVERIFHQGNSGIFLLLGDESDESLQAERIFRQVAQTHRQRIIFCISRKSSDLFLFQKLYDYLGPKHGKLPAIFISQSIGHYKYLLDEEISASAIENFISNYEQRSIARYYKSDLVPSENDGHVKIVVGYTFDEIVLDSEETVCIMYYQENCSHSQRFTPMFLKVAAEYESQHVITFAMMEAVRNEVPNLQLMGYPQVMVYPKGAKDKPVSFMSEKTEENLIKFLDYYLKPKSTHTDDL